MREYLLKKSYNLYVGKKGAAKTCSPLPFISKHAWWPLSSLLQYSLFYCLKLLQGCAIYLYANEKQYAGTWYNHFWRTVGVTQIRWS